MLPVTLGGRPVRQQDVRLRRQAQGDREGPQDSRLSLPGGGVDRRPDRHRPVTLRLNLGLAGNSDALPREVAVVLLNDAGALIGRERLDPEEDLLVRASHAEAALRIDHLPTIWDVND